jgi:hypothetical protein
MAVRGQRQPHRNLARNLADREVELGNQVQGRPGRVRGLRRARPDDGDQQQRPDPDSPERLIP